MLVPGAPVSERQLGANTQTSPVQYPHNAGGEIDPSLPDTLRPLPSHSFSHESSNGIVL